MLFSRMVARRKPNTLARTRNSVIDSTAIGTDAETVMPTFNNKYSDDAPKIMPKTAPVTTARIVNSGGRSVGGTNGLNSVAFSTGSVTLDMAGPRALEGRHRHSMQTVNACRCMRIAAGGQKERADEMDLGARELLRPVRGFVAGTHPAAQTNE